MKATPKPPLPPSNQAVDRKHQTQEDRRSEDRFRLVTATDGSCYITDGGRLALWVYGSEIKKDTQHLENAKEYAASIVSALNAARPTEIMDVVVKGF